MKKRKAEEIKSNLLSLANQIARKNGKESTTRLKTLNDVFRLYTRTSVVNYFLSVNDLLHEAGWPFPAYLDLEGELKRSVLIFSAPKVLLPLLLKSSLASAVLVSSLEKSITKGKKTLFPIDRYMCKRFRRAEKEIFFSWQQHPLLRAKAQVLLDVRCAYKKRLWGVCIPSMLPLIDSLMRDYFKSDDLRTSVGLFMDVLQLAGITPEALKPGYGVWDSLRKSPNTFRVANNVEGDLRLPGIYLVSFVEFAGKYYSWHATASQTVELNRHAVIHGDMNYWSEVNTVKLLMFFDLVLKLEPVIRILLKQNNE